MPSPWREGREEASGQRQERRWSPENQSNGCPVRLELKCAEEETLTLSVLVDMQLPRDGPLVLVVVAEGVSTDLREWFLPVNTGSSGGAGGPRPAGPGSEPRSQVTETAVACRGSTSHLWLHHGRDRLRPAAPPCGRGAGLRRWAALRTIQGSGHPPLEGSSDFLSQSQFGIKLLARKTHELGLHMRLGGCGGLS